jgi:hypothetical protein
LHTIKAIQAYLIPLNTTSRLARFGVGQFSCFFFFDSNERQFIVEVKIQQAPAEYGLEKASSGQQGCHADDSGRTDGRSDNGRWVVRDLDAL